MPTLTINVTAEFLETFSVSGGRAARFVARVFSRGSPTLQLTPSWHGEPVVAVADGGTLLIKSADLKHWATLGDALRLEVEGASGRAVLEDGSAVLVQHFLDRADPQFAYALVDDGLPPAESVVVTDGQYRDAWRALRDKAIALAEAYEQGTVASLAAITNFAADHGVEAVVLGQDGAIRAAHDLVDDLVRAHRTGKVGLEHPRPVEPQSLSPSAETTPPPERAEPLSAVPSLPYLKTEGGKRTLVPEADSRRVLLLVEAVADAFEGHAAAGKKAELAADKLRAVSESEPRKK